LPIRTHTFASVDSNTSVYKGIPRSRIRVRPYPLQCPCSQGSPFEISLLYRTIVPFCRDCGEQVEQTWKYCPHCNIAQQDPSVTVQDGVIAGDVTVSKNITNINSENLKCPMCKATGNITLHPCPNSPYSDRKGCCGKICNLCRESPVEFSEYCYYCRSKHSKGVRKKEAVEAARQAEQAAIQTTMQAEKAARQAEYDRLQSQAEEAARQLDAKTERLITLREDRKQIRRLHIAIVIGVLAMIVWIPELFIPDAENDPPEFEPDMSDPLDFAFIIFIDTACCFYPWYLFTVISSYPLDKRELKSLEDELGNELK
jgi:hypothetical protein